eukprot:TRINITY_DN36549_c0_g1_i2.p1 TRINITY_DN36549_c0_g1~~TRINITY_DN36549_c0_g1_i2.p1  ORF type:complete len:303 (-),score=74.93 TRINITY_DN36549_c0_g1_i2:19-927(-)
MQSMFELLTGGASCTHCCNQETVEHERIAYEMPATRVAQQEVVGYTANGFVYAGSAPWKQEESEDQRQSGTTQGAGVAEGQRDPASPATQFEAAEPLMDVPEKNLAPPVDGVVYQAYRAPCPKAGETPPPVKAGGRTGKTKLEKVMSEAEKKEEARKKLDVGEDLLTAKEFEQALEVFTAALAIDPSSNSAKVKRGVCLSAMDQQAEAFEIFDDVLRNDSGQMQAIHERGKIFIQMGELQKALDDFNRLVQLAPAENSALFSRGELLLKMGDREAAKQDIRRAAVLGHGPARHLHRQLKAEE